MGKLATRVANVLNRIVTKHGLAASLAAILLLLLASPGVSAKEGEGAQTEAKAEVEASAIRVVQQRPVIKAGRFELQLLGEIAIADVMFRHYSVGSNAYYHVDENWSVGASYRHYLSEESVLLKDVTEKFEVFPERAVMRWSAAVEAGWAPIYGKLAFFDDQIVHFDMQLLMGAGVTQTSRSASPRPMGVIGLAGRLLISSWFSVNKFATTSTLRVTMKARNS